jgi:hypothetical protein
MKRRRLPTAFFGSPAMLWWNLLRVAIVAATVVAVAELSKRYPRAGALLLAIPIVSVLAFVLSWLQYRDLPAISRMAKETLILVPLTLPFFVPLALANRLGLNFWAAMVLGLVMSSTCVLLWLRFAPVEH